MSHAATGPRVSQPGGDAVNGWQRTAAGGLAISHQESNADALTRFVVTDGLPDPELEAAVIAGTQMAPIEDLALRTLGGKVYVQDQRRWTMAEKLLKNPLPGNPDNDGRSVFSTSSIRGRYSRDRVALAADVFHNCIVAEDEDPAYSPLNKLNANQLEVVAEWANATGGPVIVGQPNFGSHSWRITVGDDGDKVSFDVTPDGFIETHSFVAQTDSDFARAVENRAAISNVAHRGANVYRMDQAQSERDGWTRPMQPERSISLSR